MIATLRWRLTRNRRLPECQHARYQESWRTKIIYRERISSSRYSRNPRLSVHVGFGMRPSNYPKPAPPSRREFSKAVYKRMLNDFITVANLLQPSPGYGTTAQDDTV